MENSGQTSVQFNTKGANPFDHFTFKLGEKVVTPMVYDPKSADAYKDIAANLSDWVEAAIKQRNG